MDDSLTVIIKSIPIQSLNDTGLILQAIASQILNDHQDNYIGHNGQRGQDIIHAIDLSEKEGRGEQGFYFTRLDKIGGEVDADSLSWRGVRDNITGIKN